MTLLQWKPLSSSHIVCLQTHRKKKKRRETTTRPVDQFISSRYCVNPNRFLYLGLVLFIDGTEPYNVVDTVYYSEFKTICIHRYNSAFFFIARRLFPKEEPTWPFHAAQKSKRKDLNKLLQTTKQCKFHILGDKLFSLTIWTNQVDV